MRQNQSSTTGGRQPLSWDSDKNDDEGTVNLGEAQYDTTRQPTEPALNTISNQL